MKIVFNPTYVTPFHGLSIQQMPLGGMETAIIHLAEALEALGHEVIVLTPLPNPPLTKPRYMSLSQAYQIGPVDAVIGVRSWKGCFERFKTKKTFLWLGDGYTNPHTFGIGDKRVMKQIDGLLCVSEWQADTLCRASLFPREKVALLRNGVFLPDFAGQEVRQRKRMIYSSNPQRGLIHLPLIFTALKKIHPELELHIFSNAALYDMRWPPIVAKDPKAEAILELFEGIPGCYLRGTVVQKQLARELMQSALWVYPCDIEETSCIAAMEAQAAGCVIVTTALAALPETVDEAGVLLKGLPSMQEYQQQFFEVVNRLLTDEDYYRQYQQKALKRRFELDWKKRAQELINYLNTHGLT